MLRSSSEVVDSIRLHPAYQREELLRKAWALPVAAKYAPLLSQGFLSVCGPTSVANVLRSMQVKSGRNPFSKTSLRPMSLNQLVEESGEVVSPEWQVTAVRAESVQALRAELRRSNDEGRRYIANFSRAHLFGRGGGHHSPIGGYLEAEDLVFVLDVNAGYGPWLVPTERLFVSMDTPDWAGGLRRGLARFERR